MKDPRYILLYFNDSGPGEQDFPFVSAEDNLTLEEIAEKTKHMLRNQFAIVEGRWVKRSKQDWPK